MTQARNAARKITKILGSSPMPISTMANGMIASGGVVRKNWTQGSRSPRAHPYQPIKIGRASCREREYSRGVAGTLQWRNDGRQDRQRALAHVTQRRDIE